MQAEEDDFVINVDNVTINIADVNLMGRYTDLGSL